MQEQRIIAGLGRLGCPAQGWEPLAGDASVRRYYRRRLDGVVSSEVLMDTGAPLEEADDPFCLTARFLEGQRLPVPVIRAVDAAAGLLLLEDLGDDTLERRFPAESLHEEAVDLLVKLQQLDTGQLPADLPARSLFFDHEKLHWELRFFHRHFFGGLLGLTLSPSEEELLENFYDELCHRVAGLRPRVFCHRDYHSRNLMVAPGTGRLVMIDFQDARLGPETYDLVSLLRDCYVELGEAAEQRLLDRYLVQRPEAHRDDEDESFRVRFELTALQRGIKAAGTFSYQATAMSNRRYLASLPLTVRHLERAFAALPEYGGAARLLLHHLSL